MKKIKLLKVFNLLNAEGIRLQLRLGQDNEIVRNYCNGEPDMGYRWCFYGTKIPMPVRSGAWFNGFPAEVMLNWLKENGWALETVVWPSTGDAQVFDLDFNCDKGNEAIELFDVSDIPTSNIGEHGVVNEAVRVLCRCNRKLAAIKLYRILYKCGLREAKEGVEEICNNA